MLKFEHFVINHDHLLLNTQRVWHTGEVYRDYFMVGECVRFLFTSCEGSLNERVSAANE